MSADSLPGTPIDEGDDYYLEPEQYPLLPDGVYAAVVESVRKVPSPFDDQAEQIRFTFRLSDPTYQDHASLQGFASVKLTTRSKFNQWASAIAGRSLLPGGIQLSELDGQPCKIVVVAQERQDGSGPYNKLAQVLPAQPAPAPPSSNGSGDQAERERKARVATAASGQAVTPEQIPF